MHVLWWVKQLDGPTKVGFKLWDIFFSELDYYDSCITFCQCQIWLYVVTHSARRVLQEYFYWQYIFWHQFEAARAWSWLSVEPDEEGLVVGLELDLKQGRVHPQGENVLPSKYHCINIVGQGDGASTWVARGNPSSSSSRRELTCRFILTLIVNIFFFTLTINCHHFTTGLKDKNLPGLSLLHWRPPQPAANAESFPRGAFKYHLHYLHLHLHLMILLSIICIICIRIWWYF